MEPFQVFLHQGDLISLILANPLQTILKLLDFILEVFYLMLPPFERFLSLMQIHQQYLHLSVLLANPLVRGVQQDTPLTLRDSGARSDRDVIDRRSRLDNGPEFSIATFHCEFAQCLSVGMPD